MKVRMFGYIWTIQEVILTIAVIVLLITNIITLIKYLSLKSEKISKKELSEFDKTQKTIRLLIITVLIIVIGIIITVFVSRLPQIIIWESITDAIKWPSSELGLFIFDLVKYLVFGVINIKQRNCFLQFPYFNF